MTKVEELGIRVLNDVIHVDRLLSLTAATHEVELVQKLITAAHEEGKSELQVIFDMLWRRMGTWEAEWRAENPKERELTSPDSIQIIEWKIAKARKEGAEQERIRIRGTYIGEVGGNYVIPASQLDELFSGGR